MIRRLLVMVVLVVIVAMPAGAAYELDGTGDWFQFADEDSLDPGTGDWSIALWFTANATGNQDIVRKLFAGTDSYQLAIRDTDKVRCFIGDGGSSGSDDTGAIATDGTWQHGACTFDRDGNVVAYLDAVASTGVDISGFSASDINNVDDLKIGSDENATRELDGKVAEVAMWSAVLTADEIQALADGFAPPHIRPGALVFYFPLLREQVELSAARSPTQNGDPTVADHPRIYR